MNFYKKLATIIVVFASIIPGILANTHNYTWSLLTFILPIVIITYWLSISKNITIKNIRKPFLISLSILIPMGLTLNLFLSDNFFVYNNVSATLGITIPALDLFAIDYMNPIPIEETIFYITGFPMILLLYVWSDLYLFNDKSKSNNSSIKIENKITIIVMNITMALTIILAGWLFKYFFIDNNIFPGYFAYLALVPYLATALLSKLVRPSINMPALYFSSALIFFTSLLWEVLLAIPQAWWGYQNDKMLGIFMPYWHNLPIEAILVWVLSPVTTVVVFESIRKHYSANI